MSPDLLASLLQEVREDELRQLFLMILVCRFSISLTLHFKLYLFAFSRSSQYGTSPISRHTTRVKPLRL